YNRRLRLGLCQPRPFDASQWTLVERRTGLRDRRKRVRNLGFGLLCLGIAAPASAQIYSWHDANGNLVVSNRRQNSPAQAQSYNVPTVPAAPKPKTETVRATRYVAPERIRVFDDLISEHSRNHGIRADLV